MANTALNRTTQALLTNKSGGNLNYGDVVVLDNTNAEGFTTTTTAGLSTRGLGVILEPNGIANNASGMVAVGGWAPRGNLNTAATIGQFIKTHTVAGQGTPHDSPQVEGDFAIALEASANPPILLFGSANGPSSGGAGTVTHTGTLTASTLIIGNGGADITTTTTGTGILTLLGTPSSANLAAALTDETGSGAAVFATSPTLVTPVLGTPTSGNLVNCTGLPASESAYVLIAENLLGGDAASVSFTSIPGTYRHLLLVCYARSTEAVTDSIMWMQFNADTAGNYDYQVVVGTGGTAAAAASFAQTKLRINEIPGANSSSAAQAGVARITIPHYAGTTFNKNYESTGGMISATSGGGITDSSFGQWRSTAAITRVDLLPNANNFKAGSLFSLYGLK